MNPASAPAHVAGRSWLASRKCTARPGNRMGNTCAILVCYIVHADRNERWSSSVMLQALRRNLHSARRRMAVATGFARREDGAVALEFAIIAAPFLALILASMQ